MTRLSVLAFLKQLPPRQPQCPPTEEWIKKTWSRYTTEYYSAICCPVSQSCLILFVFVTPALQQARLPCPSKDRRTLVRGQYGPWRGAEASAHLPPGNPRGSRVTESPLRLRSAGRPAGAGEVGLQPRGKLSCGSTATAVPLAAEKALVKEVRQGGDADCRPALKPQSSARTTLIRRQPATSRPDPPPAEQAQTPVSIFSKKSAF